MTVTDNVAFPLTVRRQPQDMPLVRAPMVAPTKLYQSTPTASPQEAAD